MAEYIEREVLYKKLLELGALAMARVLDTPTTSPAYQRYSAQLTERVQVARMVEDAPAADAAPVVHGRWIDTEFYGPHHMTIVQCSACKNESEGSLDDAFCPMCGAKMDKEES